MLLTESEIRRLLKENILEFRRNMQDYEGPEGAAEYTLEHCFECVWCNARDDKPREYWSGQPLGQVPFETIDTQMAQLAQEMGVDWGGV